MAGWVSVELHQWHPIIHSSYCLDFPSAYFKSRFCKHTSRGFLVLRASFFLHIQRLPSLRALPHQLYQSNQVPRFPRLHRHLTQITSQGSRNLPIELRVCCGLHRRHRLTAHRPRLFVESVQLTISFFGLQTISTIPWSQPLFQLVLLAIKVELLERAFCATDPISQLLNLRTHDCEFHRHQ